MIVVFEQAYLRELFELGRTSDKKHRFQPDIVKRYQKRVEILIAAQSAETLLQIQFLEF